MVSTNPTTEYLTLLKQREGFRNVVYSDTLGKGTCGYGHLLSATELESYPHDTVVQSGVISAWFASDSAHAYKCALQQAALLNSDSQILVNALAAVCFQLGCAWHSKFPLTWNLMLQKRWGEAAKEVERSRWNSQTPVRCKDFTDALRSLQS